VLGEDGHVPTAADYGTGWLVLGSWRLVGAGVGGDGREDAARKRHHMGHKCQQAARSHLGGSAHAATLREEQGAPGAGEGAGGPRHPGAGLGALGCGLS